MKALQSTISSLLLAALLLSATSSTATEETNLLKSEPDMGNRLTGYLKDFEQEMAENSRPAAFVDNPKPLSR